MAEAPGAIAATGAHDEIARHLHASMPPGATEVILRTSQLAAVTTATVEARRNGQHLDWLRPRAVIPGESIRRLREAMYRPGAGAWFSARFTVTSEGTATAEFNYDDEPEWDAPVDPIAYLTDQDKFPRNEKNQPEWLKNALADARRRRRD
jgi:hypothetical protein